MNRYGQMALEHTRTHRPEAYAGIVDPETFFTLAGEQVQAAVTTLRDELLGTQRAGESLEEFRHRGYQALRQAEEIVLADQVWLPAEPTTEEEDDPVLDSYRRTLAEAAEVGNRLASDF